MIVTVTPNPAIDVTYAVPALRPGQLHRVTGVARRAGGKGVNVARVLRTLGHDVVATGLSGGPSGDLLAAELAADGIAASFVPALPEIRTTVAVHGADGLTTSLWEPGVPPADPAAACDELVAHVRRLLADASALVVSGSLPPLVDPALLAALVAAAVDAGVPALVDADGEPLRHAATGPAVLLPNREELFRLDARQAPSAVDRTAAVAAVIAAADRLRAHGASAVLTTLGQDGALAVTAGGTWLARPYTQLSGNPTGAGDAATAAVAAALATAGDLSGADWPAILRDAVALSATAVTRPTAGEVDLDLYRSWRPLVSVEAVRPAA